MNRLILPRNQRVQIETEARVAAPRECCGLVEGTSVGGTFVVTAVHPMPNVAAAADAFEIDPAGHIALRRALRGTGREIIGCYHSHPDSQPEPSARDRAAAIGTGFVWLIAALTAPDRAAIAAFLFDGSGFLPLPILQTASLDPVRRPRL